MVKKLLTVLLVLSLMLAFAGCDLQKIAQDELDKIDGANSNSETLYDEDDDETNDVQTDNSGDKTGTIGTVMKTAFFDFEVLSFEVVDTYNGELPELEGKTPEAGNKFVAVDIKIINTSDDADLGDGTSGLPMFDNDFYMFIDVSDDGIYSIGANEIDWTSNEWVMKKGEIITKKLVFEVPQETASVIIGYEELYADDTVGVSHFVGFDIA